MWVQNQRNSWHGVDFPYHSNLDIAEYYERYAETLLGVDDSVGRVVEALRKRGQLDSTLVIYMGDNGFAFGEHGLIDKRTAYEESMRVPMLARCPELFSGGRTITDVIAGLDIMPTVLNAAGITPPPDLDGRSMLPLLAGNPDPKWRKDLLYEYYWERNFPQTPTLHALRTDRYKYIHYYGIWDSDELYDLQEDPLETNNLIDNAERKARSNRWASGSSISSKKPAACKFRCSATWVRSRTSATPQKTSRRLFPKSSEKSSNNNFIRPILWPSAPPKGVL